VDILGLLVEKIVELAIAWDELHAYSSSSLELSPRILIELRPKRKRHNARSLSC